MILKTIQSITEDTIRLPTRTPIRPDLVQRISRLAGAFIENIGDEGLVTFFLLRNIKTNQLTIIISFRSGYVREMKGV
jgi:hypothetical protein